MTSIKDDLIKFVNEYPELASIDDKEEFEKKVLKEFIEYCNKLESDLKNELDNMTSETNSKK